MSAGENVKVAVRVRPFNSRETSMNATLIIDMIGQTTTIKDPNNPKDGPKKFSFDYSYWSHDGFVDNDGYLSADSPSGRYADQKKVFDDLGRGVLDNAWQGYNCSLFAYGQTGSGKSYSMVGYGKNKGIVPVSSEALFQGIEEKRGSAKNGEEYQVTFSMLEIYNEQVRDLLNPKTAQIKGGMKVREQPNKGFYVEDLTTAPVNSYNDIDNKINEGTRNRTVAATNMNATSSRAHTIVAINFTQKSPNAAGQSMTKTSVINLVDLAGSERAESTGATGDRLKEGSAINQSLSTLGNVIKALADASDGKSKVAVPFRDSVLTKLLKNALGGNSKTVMIAALSPADVNFDETLSTLRFADRAKAIKTQAVVNESPTDKLIRELREENLRLQELLKKGGVTAVIAAAGGDDSSKQSPEEIEEMKRQMEAEMKKNQEEIDAMKKSWEQRVNEQNAELQAKQEAERKRQEERKTVPNIWNLNEDASLTGMITHFAYPGVRRVGNSKAPSPPEILINGLNILPEHATITNSSNKVTLTPLNSAKVLINGRPLTSAVQLKHNDRILFGSSHLYVFYDPAGVAALEKTGAKDEPPTYEAAQAEIAEQSGLKELTNSAASDSGGKSKDDLILQEDLIHILPMIGEANAMSQELKKRMTFEVALVAPQARGLTSGRTEVCVKMTNQDTGNEWMWDRNKFINRKYLMQEMYQNYVEGDADWDLPQAKDPFWEPASASIMIGTAQVILKSLAYLVETDEKIPITDFKGNDQGYLSVEVRPCDANWNNIEDDFIDNPQQLVGRNLYCKIKITQALGIHPKYEKTFCSYKFYLDDTATKTSEMPGQNPVYAFEKQIMYGPVTQSLVDYLCNSQLVIEVWGSQKDVAPKAQATPKGANTAQGSPQKTAPAAAAAATASPSKTAPSADAAALAASKTEAAEMKTKAEAAEKKLQEEKAKAAAAIAEATKRADAAEKQLAAAQKAQGAGAAQPSADASQKMAQDNAQLQANVDSAVKRADQATAELAQVKAKMRADLDAATNRAATAEANLSAVSTAAQAERHRMMNAESKLGQIQNLAVAAQNSGHDSIKLADVNAIMSGQSYGNGASAGVAARSQPESQACIIV